MKKRNLLLLMLLIFAIGFYSCGKKPEPPEEEIIICDCKENPELQVEKNPFANYSPSNMCEWINRNNDGKVIIINNDDELKKHITCQSGTTYNSIDFSKQSLLLAQGVVCGDHYVNNVSLQQLSSNKYLLNVEICLTGLSTEPTAKWSIQIRTDKLSEQTDVQLSVCVLPPPVDITSILGKWKIVEIAWYRFSPTPPFGLESHDLSQQNMVYEFKPDYILTISGALDEALLEIAPALNELLPKAGEYSYSIQKRTIYLYSQFSVRTNTVVCGEFHFSSDKKKLEISQMGVDGPRWNFVRAMRTEPDPLTHNPVH